MNAENDVNAAGEASRAGRWSAGEAYERYLGRWSTRVGLEFVTWLDEPPGQHWLDVGCGTGALARSILELHHDQSTRVVAVDPSLGFLTSARMLMRGAPVGLVVARAERLPFRNASFDVVVSGLVLNFLPDMDAGLREMSRICRTGGSVGGYVWDYTGEMWLLRHFWEAVLEIVPQAAELEEVRRFGACRPEPLMEALATAGLEDGDVEALDVPAEFRDFDDYWRPFLAGQGAAPSFLVSLPQPTQRAVADSVRLHLSIGTDGPIRLNLRAWGFRARRRT